MICWWELQRNWERNKTALESVAKKKRSEKIEVKNRVCAERELRTHSNNKSRGCFSFSFIEIFSLKRTRFLTLSTLSSRSVFAFSFCCIQSICCRSSVVWFFCSPSWSTWFRRVCHYYFFLSHFLLLSDNSFLLLSNVWRIATAHTYTHTHTSESVVALWPQIHFAQFTQTSASGQQRPRRSKVSWFKTKNRQMKRIDFSLSFIALFSRRAHVCIFFSFCTRIGQLHFTWICLVDGWNEVNETLNNRAKNENALVFVCVLKFLHFVVSNFVRRFLFFLFLDAISFTRPMQQQQR